MDQQQQFLDYCYSGQFEEAEQLYQDYKENNELCFFLEACKLGNINLIQQIYEFSRNSEFNIIIQLQIDYNQAILLACQYNQQEIVQYLVFNEKNIEVFQECFIMSCQLGHQKIVEHIIYNVEDIDICDDNNKAFKIAHQNSHIHICEWLFKNSNLVYEETLNNDDLETMKIFYQLGLCDDQNYDFLMSIKQQALIIAQWIHNHYYESLHEQLIIEYQLLSACNANDLEQVLQLYNDYENLIDIRMYSDVLFESCCQKDNIDIVLWLCSLVDVYKIEIQNNEIIKWNIIDENDKNNNII